MAVELWQWLATADPIDFTEELAAIHWIRIQDKPTTVMVIRNGAPLASTQVVRLEPYSIAREDTDEHQTSGVQRAILFGIKDHPDPLILDTDVKFRDRIIDNDMEWEVISIIPAYGEIQAVCEIRT